MFVTSANGSPGDTPEPRRRAALAVTGGAMLGLSFPPFSLGLLAWIALVPLLVLWQEHASARAAYVDACGTFLVSMAVAFQWPLFHVDGATALLSLPGLIVVPLWMAIPFGLSSAFKRRSGTAAALLLLAASYVAMEWGLRRGPFAFPWTLLGHTQAELTPINRLARYGGVPLLTGFVLLVNLLAVSLTTRWRAARLPLGGAVLAAALAVLPPVDPVGAGEPLRVGIVQPGVSAESWADFDDPSRLQALLSLSDSLVSAAPDAAPITTGFGRQADQGDRRPAAGDRGVDLVIWPETALGPGDQDARRRVRRWVNVRGVPLLTGAIDEDPQRSVYFNVARFIRPGRAEGVYRKRRLVPFAEHVPFQDRWAWLRRLAIPSGGVAGYARGTTPGLMEIQNVRFGVLICFETLFDDAAREYARGGANVILAITQDGWWGDSFGHRQHLAFNRLRAIETGLAVVQVSVSGTSAVIRPDGRVRDRIGWMERRAALIEVRPTRANTPYVRLGDWMSPLALTTMLLLYLTTATKRSR